MHLDTHTHTYPGVYGTENILSTRHPEAEQHFLNFIFPKHCCRPDIFSYSCMRYKIIFFKMGKISSYFHSVLLQKSLEKLTFLCIGLQASQFRRGKRVKGKAGCELGTKAASCCGGVNRAGTALWWIPYGC